VRQSRLWLLVGSALTGFAANSLLTRAAVGGHSIGAIAFTQVRLVTGALTLVAIAALTGSLGGASFDRLRTNGGGKLGTSGGKQDTWIGAAALGTYAFAFAFAYARIDASVGALMLFGAVQLTMLGWGMATGERPRALEWIGLLLALAGLAVLTRPGRSAPDVIGSLLMAIAGGAWGVYSLRGRGAGAPLLRTATSFVWASVAGVGIVAVTLPHSVSVHGVVLASISGALASGVGYTLWYFALPHLTAFRAALVQLGVPVLTAMSAVPLLGERLSLRLVTAGSLIVAGIALAVIARKPR
jgi:drug/metabolite transporter (DMT)-like permease